MSSCVGRTYQFRLRLLKKQRTFSVNFRESFRQTFCGFASLHKFFVPIGRECGDVWRPGSCSEWFLLLGLAVVVGQFGCCSCNPPSGMENCLGPPSWGGWFEWRSFFTEEMEMLCSISTITGEESSRCSAGDWFPRAWDRRLHWKTFWRHLSLEVSFWSSSQVILKSCVSLVFSMLFLLDVEASSIHNSEHSLWKYSVNERAAFPNISPVWSAFSDALLVYISALVLTGSGKNSCL